MANILASSLDNFIILNNSHTVEQPYVTFTVGNPTNVIITIKDRHNDDGYYKEIVGNSTSVISSNSFNTGGVVALNIMECLKMNSIFFNVTLNGANTVKANIDTSISYSISVSGGGITVGGTYSTYEALSPNKMVVMLQGNIDENTTNITMEKFNNNPSVSFNVTSPFKYSSMRTPLDINITAYQVYDSKSSLVAVPYSTATILPTTLNRFQKVDYDEFYYNGGYKKHFLTNNEKRFYNYNEWIGLSMLSSVNVVGLKKSFYTNSGVFLEDNYSTQYVEKNGIRYDIYDTFELGSIEAVHDKQVGYVLVYAWDGSNEISEPVRFDVIPHCNGNNEIFFLNEIGGIDSFNFTNVKEVERTIEEQSTYFINPIRDYTDRYELQYTKQKRNQIAHTVSTHQVDLHTAKWLNELNKTKYAFLFLGMHNPKFKMIVIDKFDITTNTSDDEFEFEMEYHSGDNEENL